MVELPPDVAVFAVACDATGQWFALSPVAHELSGRHGIRQVGAALNPDDVPHQRPQYPYEPRRRCRLAAEPSWLDKLNNDRGIGRAPAAVRPAATLSWLEKLMQKD